MRCAICSRKSEFEEGGNAGEIGCRDTRFVIDNRYCLIRSRPRGNRRIRNFGYFVLELLFLCRARDFLYSGVTIEKYTKTYETSSAANRVTLFVFRAFLALAILSLEGVDRDDRARGFATANVELLSGEKKSDFELIAQRIAIFCTDDENRRRRCTFLPVAPHSIPRELLSARRKFFSAAVRCDARRADFHRATIPPRTKMKTALSFIRPRNFRRAARARIRTRMFPPLRCGEMRDSLAPEQYMSRVYKALTFVTDKCENWGWNAAIWENNRNVSKI